MLRHPPRSTLFPTRRSSDLLGEEREDRRHHLRREPERRLVEQEYPRLREQRPRDREQLLLAPRSEEHTSELQSRQYLVCRLLLEKKKKAQVQHQLQLEHLET